MTRTQPDKSLRGLDIEAALATGFAAARNMGGAVAAGGASVGVVSSGAVRAEDKSTDTVSVDAVPVEAVQVTSAGATSAMMFTDAAIAASYRAAELGVGPYPLSFLAGCVRTLGLPATHALPEPLIGAEPTELVRGWMAAAGALGPIDVTRDELFARWLERVAMMIAVRRQAARPPSAAAEATPIVVQTTSPKVGDTSP